VVDSLPQILNTTSSAAHANTGSGRVGSEVHSGFHLGHAVVVAGE